MKAQKSWTAAELVASSLPADFPHIVPRNRITPGELLDLIAAGRLTMQGIMDQPKKLLRAVREKSGNIRMYVGDDELLLLKFTEDYSKAGHTVTLTILDGQIEWIPRWE